MVSSGSLSSIKIEIVVLNSEFGADERQDWTENEFNASVLRERQGKRPLVTGDVSITLVDGVGNVDNVIFTDNSSWIRSRKFRLGARIVQRISGESTIREATSEAFIVKDHRGELYKKHYPPFLHDEVWRLERIAKDGTFNKRLTSNNIFTVKDFLRLHVIDSSALRHLLVEDAKRQAYKNVGELVSVDRRATIRPLMPMTSLLPEPLGITNLLLQQPEFSVENEDKPDTSHGNFNHSSTSYVYETEDTNQLQVCLQQDELAIQAFNPTLRNSFRMGDTFHSNGENSLSFLSDDHFATEDNSEAEMPIWISTTPPWGHASGSVSTPAASESSSSNFDVNNQRSMGESRDVWPKARWLKLRAVIHWRSFTRGAA